MVKRLLEKKWDYYNFYNFYNHYKNSKKNIS